MAVTGQAIREEGQHYGLIELLSSATGGAASYITDTLRLQSTALSASAYGGCMVRMSSGNRDGEISRVDYIDTANGRLYVTPNFTGAISSGETYEIWKEGINPDDVDRARDKALTYLCSTWSIYPISLVPNAGYFDTLGAGNWLAIGGATRAIQSLSFPYEFAENSLLVTNAAANEGVVSPSIYPRPNQSFYLYVPVSVRSGTGELVVRDVTNSANISLSGTSTATGRGWTGIEVTFSIPGTCNEINIQLRGQQATAIVEWGPVYFHGQEMKMIQVPARVITRSHVGPVYFLSNVPTVSGGTYWGEEQMEERTGVRRQQIGDAVRFVFEDIPGQFPYFYLERNFFDALSADYKTVAQRVAGDAATTNCPLDYVAPGMVRLLAERYMRLQPNQEDFWTGVLRDSLTDHTSAERCYGPLPFPIKERGRVISLPIYEV